MPANLNVSFEMAPTPGYAGGFSYFLKRIFWCSGACCRFLNKVFGFKQIYSGASKASEDSLKKSFCLKKGFEFLLAIHGEIMKRSFMLAATLAATPLFAVVAKASPDQMFVISTPTAGVVDFRGTGSATFTNTQGSTDSVTIGSNSSIGVTATGSNSSDYTSSAAASLDLAATTSLNHATGTASQAFNMMYNTATTASADTKLTDQVAKISSVSTTSTTADGSAVLDVLSSSLHQQAESKANEVAGSSSASGSGGTNGVDYGGDDNAWDAAWKAVYNEEYAKGYSAVKKAAPTTYSHDLAVNGVGTIANVDAKDTSTFNASTHRIDGSTTLEGGSGTASASMTNSNTTFANTAETTSATAFAQAFNGGNAANSGDLTITNVSGDSASGYTITGTRTTTETVTYQADSSGNVTPSGT